MPPHEASGSTHHEMSHDRLSRQRSEWAVLLGLIYRCSLRCLGIEDDIVGEVNSGFSGSRIPSSTVG